MKIHEDGFVKEWKGDRETLKKSLKLYADEHHFWDETTYGYSISIGNASLSSNKEYKSKHYAVKKGLEMCETILRGLQ